MPLRDPQVNKKRPGTPRGTPELFYLFYLSALSSQAVRFLVKMAALSLEKQLLVG